MRRISILLFLFTLSFATLAAPQNNNGIQQVIYITFDGVRWQDVFQKDGYFKKLWSKYAKQGTFYGAPHSHTKMNVASIPISLPSYQSQMSGAVQPCDGNDCGRIHVETMSENLLHVLNLQKKDVVTFASWKKIDYAFEHYPRVLFTNIGNVPLSDPTSHEVDSVMADLNKRQTVDHPGNGDRYDKYTFAQAMHYLEKYQPRFMWISLTDADDAAHANNLKRYHQALSFYDDTLDQLFTFLKSKKMDKNTFVIISTDHGRGNGRYWTNHGAEYPESKQMWAFTMNGELLPENDDHQVQYFSTLSIRPSIETALIRWTR